MYHHRISFAEALALVRESRPFCDPNSGFVQQLELYHSMGMPENIDEEPAYQRWLYHREIELSRACNQAPDADKIRFEDEHSNDTSANPAAFELRCRKCR
jgi:dual specificity phosphatase 12